MQPVYGDIPTLSWHDGFDLSFEYETIMTNLIMNEHDFEVCRYESSDDFTNGCTIAYFDFCDWVSHLDPTIHFDSTQSLFDRFVTSHQIELTDSYRHPSWLDDIFWLLDFALTSTSNRLDFLERENIEAVIRQKRTTYFHHYPL